MRQRRVRGYLGSGPNDRERRSARLFVRTIPFSDVTPGLSPFLTRSNPVPPGSNIQIFRRISLHQGLSHPIMLARLVQSTSSFPRDVVQQCRERCIWTSTGGAKAFVAKQ